MPKPFPPRQAALILALAAALPAPASAQLIGGGLGAPPIMPTLPSTLPSAPAPIRRPAAPDLPRRPELPAAVAPLTSAAEAAGAAVGSTGGAVEGALGSGQALAQQAAGSVTTYAQAAQRLLQAHPEVLEADARGAPVVRGEVLALAPSAQALARARQLGFRVRTTEDLGGLGLQTVTLTPPAGMSAAEALRRLQAADPAGEYDLNHIYVESGVAASAGPARGLSGGAAAGARLGLVDGSVAARQPVFAASAIEQRAFGPGGAKVSAHATAVASLMVGRDGRFRGAAPGARLRVADVYGPTAAGGSATAIARGLAWLAETRTPVIDISLVGPPNGLLAAAVRALVSRGHLVVAAVGNDGPAAPPLYPAAYPGVIAVTAVDPSRRLLPEAGRAGHVDFAAPGAGLAAARPDGGFQTVRGTSFAAPLVAGALAQWLAAPEPAAARRAVVRLAQGAEDLGPRGPDGVYGRGLVAFSLRVDPAAVGARGLAMQDR